MRSTAVNVSGPAVVPSAQDLQPLLEALKSIAAAMKADGVPFALAGSYAVYARGGARSLHDVDFVVPADAVPAAVASLEHRGFRIVQPPEDWLVKAFVGDLCIDVIHTLSHGPVDQGMLDRADELPVESVVMPVLAATDLLIAKLRALWEHSCDLEPVLALARTLREQIDFATVAAAAEGHPYAETGLFLIGRLGLVQEIGDIEEEGTGHGRIE
jgi:hypothetical protein